MENYDKKVLDLAMEAGKILLDAGAEIFRVEETIRRIAASFGIERCNPFVMSTGIILTAENEKGEIYAKVNHIPIQGARLHRIAAVNQLSREISEGKYTLEEAEKKIEAIQQMPEKRALTKIAAAGIGSGSFCYLLGGGLGDMLAAFLASFLLMLLLTQMDRREKKTSKIVTNLIGGFCASFFSVLFYRMGVGKDLGSILVGAVMPLVPGVSLVNAIRDFAESNYIGGSVRFLDALMVALGISIGVALMYLLYYRFTGRMML